MERNHSAGLPTAKETPEVLFQYENQAVKKVRIYWAISSKIEFVIKTKEGGGLSAIYQLNIPSWRL